MDDLEQVLPRLTKLDLFSDFNPEKEEDKRSLKALYETHATKKFKAGEVIIKEGEKGDSFYILYTASVQVLQKTLANDNIALAILKAEQGICFGEAALIGHDVRSASVIALTDCSTILLSGEQFIALCEKEPVLGYHVIYRIAKRLASTIKKTNHDKSVLYEALLNEVDGTTSP